LLSLYSLPEINNERVDRQLEWYLDHPSYIARIQQRAEPYLHLILNEIEEKNIPGELALLPVVESAFIPDAYSSADASGLWQFIPSTGYQFGLQQNQWYDGRRDIYASTKAATTFLKNLGDSFEGDWFLALASYNYGKGNVIKSIEKNENLAMPTDYWSLSLPKETADYVPRLLAIAKLFANADQYNINLRNIPDKPYFEVVDIKAPLDLDKAAELANTPLDKFLKLNPGFKGQSTAPQGPHRLLVPVAHAQAFKTRLAMLPFSERVELKRYNDESLAQPPIIAANDADKPAIAAIPKFIPDERPVIQSSYDERQTRSLHDEKPQHIAATSITAATATSNSYKVKAGDTLSDIARKYHISMKFLQQANHLSDSTARLGTTLYIPSTGAKLTELAKTTVAPSERSGHSRLASLQSDSARKVDTATKLAVSSKNLEEWHKIKRKVDLQAGQKLAVKAASEKLAAVSFKKSKTEHHAAKDLKVAQKSISLAKKDKTVSLVKNSAASVVHKVADKVRTSKAKLIASRS
jgi:membrane-bound lytic murein transglycosylase D